VHRSGNSSNIAVSIAGRCTYFAAAFLKVFIWNGETTMSIRKFMVAIVFALGAMQSAFAADVTGTWTMTVESPMGTGTPTFTLAQKGEVVTGTYKGQLGEAKVAGTLKGNELSLAYDIDAQGMQLKITYSGTVDGNTMAGKVKYGDQGDGTFKGTKQ
jgi:hypothetical protein